MLRLLSLLFLGYWRLPSPRPPPCNHKWEEYKSVTYTRFGANRGTGFIRNCKHCGELKEFDFSI